MSFQHYLLTPHARNDRAPKPVEVEVAYMRLVFKCVEDNNGGGETDLYPKLEAKRFAAALRQAIGRPAEVTVTPAAALRDQHRNEWSPPAPVRACHPPDPFVEQFRVQLTAPDPLAGLNGTAPAVPPKPPPAGLQPAVNRRLLDSILAMFEGGAVFVQKVPY